MQSWEAEGGRGSYSAPTEISLKGSSSLEPVGIPAQSHLLVPKKETVAQILEVLLL